MIRIIIVDDEMLDRVGFQTFLSQKTDIEIVGTFGYARDALEFLSRNGPVDIVITDIEMAEMDGLAFINRVRQNIFARGIIVVSAYANFQYAQKAMELGADQYILKQEIDTDNLYCAIKKLYDSFPAQSQQKAGHSALNETKDRGLYSIGVLQFSQRDGAGETFIQTLYNQDMIRNLIEELTERYHMGILFQPANKNMFILFEFDKDTLYPERKDKIKKYANVIQRFLTQYISCPMVFGIYMDFWETSEIPADYMKASQAAEMSFYSEDSIFFFEETKDELPVLDLDENCFFSEGGSAHIIEVLEDYIALCREKRIQAEHVKEYLFQVVNHLLYKVLKQQQYSENEINMLLNRRNLGKLILNSCNAQTMVQDLQEVFVQIIREVSSRSGENEISAVLLYMNEHFSEKLTLEEMAKLSCLSVPNFCKKFKECTGKTFVQYLNGIRIRKAMEELRDSNYTIDEIAERTGFSNQNYLSRVFKKVTGRTITDFRR